MSPPTRFERGTLPFADLAGVAAAVEHEVDMPAGGAVSTQCDDDQVVTTRTYQDRLDTLEAVRDAIGDRDQLDVGIVPIGGEMGLCDAAGADDAHPRQ